MDAFDIPVLELEHRGKLTPDGLPQEPVFHRRKADDGGGQNRIFPARDGRDVQDGVLSGQRVETVMVAKGPFQFGFGRVAIPFDDDVSFCGNPQILRERLGDGQRFLPQDARKLILGEVVGKRRNRRENQFRWPPDANGNGHAFALGGMLCAVLVNLPVQAEFGFVVNLGTVHSQVVLARSVLGHDQRERDEMTAVHRPRLGNGEFCQVVVQTNALSLSFPDFFGRHGEGVSQQRQPLPRLPHVQADVGLHHRHHAITDFRFVGGPESSQRTVVASEGVHEQGDGGHGSVGQTGLLKQHRRTVVLHQQVGDGSRLVNNIDGPVDAKEFPSPFKVVNPPPQRPPSHALAWGFSPLNLRISANVSQRSEHAV